MFSVAPIFILGGRLENDKLLVLFQYGILKHTNKNAGVTMINVIMYYDHPTASIPKKFNVITKANYITPTIIL